MTELKHTFLECSTIPSTISAKTSKVWLLCSNSTSLKGTTMDRTHVLTVHTHTHTHTLCIQSSSSMESQIQPAAGWTAPQPDVMSPLLFMHLFLSSAALSEPNPPPTTTTTPYSPPALQLPPANKGGQIQYSFNKGQEKYQRQTQRRERDGEK